MRGPSLAKIAVWTLLLSWPWIVTYVARYSPQMIARGLAESSSLWMPIGADILLIAGGLFALRTRRNVIGQTTEIRNVAYRKGHHLRGPVRQAGEKSERR